jgi:PST family polysaccharide transporter
MSELTLSLHERVIRGASYLLVRQGLGIFIGFANVIILTRLIGPKNYGLYTASLGIISFFWIIGRLGTDVYLIRRKNKPSVQVYHQAFTIAFCTGLLAVLVGIAAVAPLQKWYRDPAFIPPYVAMLLVLPFGLLAGPALARLERDLKYRAVSVVELSGQIIYCLVSLSLALSGKGVWAPVIGYILWQLLVLFLSCIIARLVPRPYWSMTLAREMIRYGIGFAFSNWIWHLRLLVNPLIVGRYAGAQAVGFVALTIRFGEVLSFVRQTAWRLSFPTLSKIQHDYQRLKRAVEDAMSLQVLGMGPPLGAFALAAPLFLPSLLGERWIPVLTLYPFIAAAILFGSIFNMHSSVLYVLKRNLHVASFHLIHVFLFYLSAALLVPRYGISGYAWSEVIVLPVYAVIHLQVKTFFRPNYRKVFPWIVVFTPPLFGPLLPTKFVLLLWLPLILSFCLPQFRTQLSKYAGYLTISK